MAQLKDTVVSGSLRATDTLYTSTLQTSIIKAPSSSSGSDYAAGTAGYVLKSGGTNGKIYWAADSAGVTSVRVQATSPVVSSVNTAQGSTLDTTISLANNYGDTKNPYASKTKNTVLAAGATADSVPSFRTLVANDIPTLTPGKVGLGNVTNHAQVTSLAYDSTNRKITYKISEGTAQTLVTFGSNAFTSFSNQITIGSKTITLGGSATLAEIGVNYPVTSVNNKTGAVTISASDLGLSNAMHFKGIATVDFTASNFPGISGYTPVAGDVVIDKDKKYEYVYVDSTNKWELLGGDESYALSNHTHTISLSNTGSSPISLSANTTYTLTAGGESVVFKTPADNNTNYYHTTGSWNNLTYTATANGGAGALAFTIPTGTSSTQVAIGNHTHNYAGSSSAGGAATTATTTTDTTNTLYPIGVTSAATTTLKRDTSITFAGGTITATSFSGSGAALTALNASNVTTGTLNVDRLPASNVTANTYGNTTQQSPSHSGTFNIPYFTVDAKGRVTSAGTTTVKLPSDSNTDTLVKQTSQTAASELKLLSTVSASPSSGSAAEAGYDTNVTINPSTHTITASSYKVTANALITYNATTGCLEITV